MLAHDGYGLGYTHTHASLDERLGALSPDSAVQVRVEVMGQEQIPVLVLDHAVSDVEALDQYAREKAVFKPVPQAGNAYPGVRAPMPKAYAAWVFNLLKPLFHQVFGFPAQARVQVKGCDLSIVTTPPEGLNVAQRYPHFDTPEPYQLAVLHYLRDEAFGGTGFYRHRRTGFERITPERLGPYQNAIAQDISEQGRAAAQYVNGDMATFERIGLVNSRRNRIVVYPSNMLHSGNIQEDIPRIADPDQGRLTINTFLHIHKGPNA